MNVCLITRKKVILAGLGILFTILLFACSALANTLNKFELKDGSVVQGEILSYSKGVYRVNSLILGTISVPEDKIRAIHPVSPSGKPNRSLKPSAREIEQAQQRMMNDPETMQLIQQLQNDPSVQNILQDKDLMEAIAKGDLGRVGNDPKIKALMEKETVGKIIEKNH